MDGFEFKHSLLNHVILITPKINIREKDMFIKTYEKYIFKNHGIDFIPTEEYMIREEKAVFRGIHLQNHKPQKRIITVLSGDAYITVVDLNRQSPELGKYEIFLLEEEEPRLIYVPEWYGIATISLRKNTIISVMNSGQYYEQYSAGICYNDPTLNIQWPLQDFWVSRKDASLMTFQEYLHI